MPATARRKTNEVESSPDAAVPKPERQACLLLIEDNKEAMAVVRAAVDEHANGTCRLEWAVNLCEGLNRLTRGGVDLVLLDLGLPESSGFESYAWVREIAPHTPVVVLTADERQETEFAAATGGPEGYLVKHQVSGAMVIEAVKAALSANEERVSEQTAPRRLARPPFTGDQLSTRKRPNS